MNVKKRWILIGLLLLSGCGRQKLFLSNFKQWVLECPNPFESRPDDPVLARAGDVVVRESEYLASEQTALELRHFNPTFKMASPDNELHLILRQKVMAQLAKDAGVTLSPTVRLSLQMAEYSQWAAAFKRSMSVTNDAMVSYYRQHLNDFRPNEIAILRLPLKSLAQAQKAQVLLKKGRSWPSVAKLLSTTVLHERLSTGGFQPKEPELLQAVSLLKPGESAGPLKTDIGFEIVRREAAPASSVLPFDAVKERVRADVQEEMLEQLYQTYIADAKVQVNKDLLNSIDLSSTTTTTPSH